MGQTGQQAAEGRRPNAHTHIQNFICWSKTLQRRGCKRLQGPECCSFRQANKWRWYQIKKQMSLLAALTSALISGNFIGANKRCSYPEETAWRRKMIRICRMSLNIKKSKYYPNTCSILSFTLDINFYITHLDSSNEKLFCAAMFHHWLYYFNAFVTELPECQSRKSSRSVVTNPFQTTDSF